MNLVFDDDWLKEAARLEDMIDGEITAGYSGPPLSQVLANPAGNSVRDKLMEQTQSIRVI